jgi:acetyl esterase/lipase
MKHPSFFLQAAALVVLSFTSGTAVEPIDLWPHGAPGEKGALPPEADTTKATDALIAGKRVIRLGNVTNATISVFQPTVDQANGAAVLVCPGGGYHILAMDLEGTEICAWLNSLGVTAVLLKYRVPKREGLERHAAPLQDAQRALGLVRQHAGEWKIDPNRIGCIGFSAGAHLCAALATNYENRTYDPIDEADQQSCRPDFAMLIYPGYLTVKEKGDTLPAELHVNSRTPPTFLTQTQDDGVRVESSLFYYLALAHAGVPAELHLYPTGGHGYGLRPTEHNVTTWPKRAADWLRALRALERKN